MQSSLRFYSVLKPGGLLLLAESTRAFIESWIIRWLFRHPMEAQRSAAEYEAMIARRASSSARRTCRPYLWWSRADSGVREFFGLGVPPQGRREETLVNLVASKPARA
jgi:hypothetical protein